MEIEIKLDASCKNPKIIIVTNQVTEGINDLVSRLSGTAPQILVGFRDGRAEVLEQEKICRVYAAGGKVFAEAENGRYTLRLRLYELEERLNKSHFVRISNSEIINLKKVKGFDLSLAGTICVTFCNGEVTYDSRRYVTKIKQVLGI